MRVAGENMQERTERHIRLKAEDVADQLSLVSAVIAHLASPVDQVDTLHPLIDGEVDLAREIVEMADQRADDLARARRGLWARRIDDILGEVRIEPVSNHFCGEMMISKLRCTREI